MDNFVFLWLLSRAFAPISSAILFLIAWFACRRIARRPIIDRKRWFCLLAALVVSLPIIGICDEIFVDGPLWHAADDGNVTEVKRLLDAGAYVNKSPEEAEGSPLMIAAYDGHADVVRLLIEHGADVNQKDAFFFNKPGSNNMYQTPLQVAQGKPEIVTILKQAGAR